MKNFKKLLSIISLLAVSVPATLSVVSCKSEIKEIEKNKEKIKSSINTNKIIKINFWKEQQINNKGEGYRIYFIFIDKWDLLLTFENEAEFNINKNKIINIINNNNKFIYITEDNKIL